MENKTLVFISSALLVLSIPIILFFIYYYSFMNNSEGLEQPEVKENIKEKTFQVSSISYNDVANFTLPKKSIGLRSNPDTKGKGFVFEKEGKFYIYLIYTFSTVTEKPTISTNGNENDLIITAELPYKDPNGFGLTAMSYHNFEIEVNGDFDKVILNETTKTVE